MSKWGHTIYCFYIILNTDKQADTNLWKVVYNKLIVHFYLTILNYISQFGVNISQFWEKKSDLWNIITLNSSTLNCEVLTFELLSQNCMFYITNFSFYLSLYNKLTILRGKVRIVKYKLVIARKKSELQLQNCLSLAIFSFFLKIASLCLVIFFYWKSDLWDKKITITIYIFPYRPPP